MKIFIAYHYGEDEKWVETLLYPLVKAFGHEVVDGKHVADKLAEGITEKIEECSALIAVLSRRDKLVSGGFITHPWALQELTTARTKGLAIAPSQDGVVFDGGILGDTLIINYESAKIADCLVNVAGRLAEWRNKFEATVDALITLLPAEFSDDMGPHVFEPDFNCRCHISDPRRQPKSSREIKIDRTPGSLQTMLRDLPRGHYIRIEASYGTKQWTSALESVEAPSITMRKAK